MLNQDVYLMQASSKAGCWLAQAPVQVPVRHQVHVQQLVGACDCHVVATWAQLVRVALAEHIILH